MIDSVLLKDGSECKIVRYSNGAYPLVVPAAECDTLAYGRLWVPLQYLEDRPKDDKLPAFIIGRPNWQPNTGETVFLYNVTGEVAVSSDYDNACKYSKHDISGDSIVRKRMIKDKSVMMMTPTKGTLGATRAFRFGRKVVMMAAVRIDDDPNDAHEGYDVWVKTDDLWPYYFDGSTEGPRMTVYVKFRQPPVASR